MSEIKQVLTDDQRMRYDVLLGEHDARRAERRRTDSRKYAFLTAYAPTAGLNSGYRLGVNLVSVRYNYVLTRVELEAVLGRDL
jgi:hypothetical protein